jgi:hypothetical protein
MIRAPGLAPALLLAFVSFTATASSDGVPDASSAAATAQESQFPFVGHTYLVDFGQLRYELNFTSDTSMTYTRVEKDGSRGGSETVTIAVTPIRDQVFMVTWQEADKTTVVHVEDYANSIVYTNITFGGADDKFVKFKGTLTLIK